MTEIEFPHDIDEIEVGAFTLTGQARLIISADVIDGEVYGIRLESVRSMDGTAVPVCIADVVEVWFGANEDRLRRIAVEQVEEQGELV